MGYSIVEYDPRYKSCIVTIALDDKEQLFGGGYLSLTSIATDKRGAVEKHLDQASTKLIESACDNPLVYKKLLLEGKTFAGFVFYTKYREESLESVQKEYKKELLNISESIRAKMPDSIDETELLKGLPHLKKTDAECIDYVLLDKMAVAKNFRGKKYGEKLLLAVIEDAKKRWPHIARIELGVLNENKAAIGLYEKVGFIKSKEQTANYTMLGAVRYEKSLTK